MTEEMLVQKLKLFGYEPFKHIDVNKTILELYPFLQNLPENGMVRELFISSKKMFEDANAFISRHNFHLHAINYVDAETMLKQMQGVTSIEDALSRINGLITRISPLELPITWTPEHTMAGEIQKPLMLIPDDTYLREAPICFSTILLGNNITKISPATYIHELTHSQLESQKGIVRDYHNKEVLSIFMEKVVAAEQAPKAFAISDRMRLRALLENMILWYMNRNNHKVITVDQETYIISILKAYNLYDLYNTSSKDIKREILLYVQKVFNGELTVEDLLTKFHITEEPIGVKKSFR